jgi:hypothetical protein
MLKLAFTYAARQKVAYNFCKDPKLSDRDWLQGFMRRHLGISLRRPQATSINRITAFNKEEITFYENLEGVMMKYQFTPDKVYNVEETGINTVQKPVRILGEKGGKRVGTAVSWKRRRNVTVVWWCYGERKWLYPRKRLSETMKRH